MLSLCSDMEFEIIISCYLLILTLSYISHINHRTILCVMLKDNITYYRIHYRFLYEYYLFLKRSSFILNSILRIMFPLIISCMFVYIFLLFFFDVTWNIVSRSDEISISFIYEKIIKRYEKLSYINGDTILVRI